jgi:HEAT repeat protein
VNKSFRNGFNAAVALTILVSLHCTASAGAAAAAARPQLDEVIAIATSANPRGTAVRASSDAINAIKLLGKWTTASADDEAKIAAVLEELLEFDDPPIRRAAAGSLGGRGRSEIVPRLATLFAFDPRLFTQFYMFGPEARTPTPPLNLLLAALRSDQWQVRDDSLTVVTRYKVAGLREEAERIVELDPASSVRREAGLALEKIGTAKSVAVLTRVAVRYPDNDAALRALGALGGDAEVPVLLTLLEGNTNATVRRNVLWALWRIKLTEPKPMLDGLVRVLEQDPMLLSAATILAGYHDARALKYLRRIVETPRQWEFMEDEGCVRAIADVGGPGATKLLNELVANGWYSRAFIERELVKIGDANSARVVWSAYLEHPVRRVISGWCATTAGYREAFPVLAAYADRELLEKIRARASETPECAEEKALSGLITSIEQRLRGEGHPRGG